MNHTVIKLTYVRRNTGTSHKETAWVRQDGMYRGQWVSHQALPCYSFLTLPGQTYQYCTEVCNGFSAIVWTYHECIPQELCS